MPLKVNVGLSRKVSDANYGSRGASVTIEAEVDSSLAFDPPKLQERLRQLFAMVRTSLAEELEDPTSEGQSLPISNAPTITVPASSNGNGRTVTIRPATRAQVKALFAITRQQGIDLATLIRARFNAHRADDLSLREASRLIDEL